MTLFQILTLIVLGVLLSVTMIALLTRRATRRHGILWSIVWVAAGAAIIWPSAIAAVARVLGIGRGADLVTYCAVVVMLVGFLMVYVRIRRLQRDMTLLVRHIAIREAVQGHEDRDRPSTSGAPPSSGGPDT